jgi:hypothetical protein
MVKCGVLYEVRTEFLNNIRATHAEVATVCRQRFFFRFPLFLRKCFPSIFILQLTISAVKSVTMLSLPQALTTHHQTVFSLILSLSQGLASVFWEPVKNMFFPRRNRASFASPQNCFCSYSTTVLPDSRSYFRELTPEHTGYP